MARGKVDRSFEVVLPGIDSGQIRDLEDLLPKEVNLANNWSTLAVCVVILAQIVNASKSKLKHQDYTSSESIGRLVKRILANSSTARSIYALAAMRRTLATYDLSTPSSSVAKIITSDYIDLVENPTGAASTKGGERAAFTSEERTRKYRRGLMLQAAGSISNRTITRPQIAISRADCDRATIDLIIGASPFKKGANKSEVVDLISRLLAYDDETVVDNFKLSYDSNLAPLEQELGLKFSRESLEISPQEIAVDFDSLDPVQKLIFNSKKRLT